MASWGSSAASYLIDWVGAVVIQKIVDMGFDSFWSKPMDSEAALKRVEVALPQIRAVMGVAEALKMEDPSCGEWVHRFREAVDAAEDAIDELEYKKLEDEVQNRSDDQVAGSSSASKKRKKTGAISADILERLKKAVTMLDEATDGMEDLLQRADRLGIRYLSQSQFEVRPNSRRETTSLLAEREVFGRDVEKAQIIGWLTRETEAPLSSVGIVGMGGLGKTTLAQSVNQELSGSGYFEKIIWVCVSTEFSVEGITKNILAGMGVGCHGDNPLDVLQKNLKEKIHSSKKVLLILDDIWEDGKRRDWEQLLAPLRFAQQGSKILFTTRQKSVANLLANVLNTEHESLPLQNLEEKELRLLFNSYAFRGSNPNQHGNLQAIGDQIVKKLHGNPLAAKVIGSLLNSRMDSLYWGTISNHKSLINLEQANDVMDVLKLSYYNLPADLQVCFRFCSIFPQDYRFDKKELIKMWMASGFIPKQSCEGRRPEDIGEDYFNLLLRKSFFKIYEYSGMEERYVMHDLIHELAQNVSNGECWRVAPGDKSIAIPSTVRHVSVHECEIQKVFHLENIRSLVITTARKQQNGTNPNLFVLPNNLVKKSLRLLKINAFCSCKLLEEMSCLVHLRYLSIELNFASQSFKYLLPASIYKLYHLLVLEFKQQGWKSSYSGIETAGMANLVSLRHMWLPDEIMKTICGVQRMTFLQELTFFVGKESGYRINELRTLNNLKRLTIHNVENIGDPAEARSANLLAKKNLESLSLQCTKESKLDNPDQIFDNLRPYQNIMELVIKNYKGHRFPLWVRDIHLKILHIFECPNLVQLPEMPLSVTEFRVDGAGLTSLPNFDVNTLKPSSQKSSLKVVEINNCPNLITLNGFLQQGNLELQGLEKLAIKVCENLAQLSMHAFRTTMSLKYLTIIGCPNLTGLPGLPLSLITFKIFGIAVSALPEYFESPGSSGGPSPLQEVHIQNCPNLTALNGFLQQDNIDFRAFHEIIITECENLVRIPMGVFWKFESLTDLTIADCPKLVAIDNPNNLLPSKLEKLTIENCGELDVPLLESSSRLTTLTDLEIINCENITHIPSKQNVFGSLSQLSIGGCPKLIELSLMQQAHSVDRGSNVASLTIKILGIDELSLLLIEPLRSLRSVSNLDVDKCSKMDALPEQWLLQNSSTLESLVILNASTLQSLPATMARLTALKFLEIHSADSLMELLDLPASLKVQIIQSSNGADKF